MKLATRKPSGSSARLYLIIAFLSTLTSFILIVLVVFAGSKSGTLENVNLLTVNASMLGQTFLDTSKPSTGILSSIENQIKGEVNSLAGDVAKDLNIHDFYSVHILDYCEGYYTPGPISNSTVHPKKNITYCSKHQPLFHFDPTAIIQSELKSGVSLNDLQWPDSIRNGVRGLEILSKVMFVLYCIAIGATGVALLMALVGLLTSNMACDFLNIFFAGLSFLALLIASSLATKIIKKTASVVNDVANEIGVFVYEGKTFMGMTWAATVLMFLTMFVWAIALFKTFRGRRR